MFTDAACRDDGFLYLKRAASGLIWFPQEVGPIKFTTNEWLK